MGRVATAAVAATAVERVAVVRVAAAAVERVAVVRVGAALAALAVTVAVTVAVGVRVGAAVERVAAPGKLRLSQRCLWGSLARSKRWLPSYIYWAQGFLRPDSSQRLCSR